MVVDAVMSLVVSASAMDAIVEAVAGGGAIVDSGPAVARA